MVKKLNGDPPTPAGVSLAASTFKTEKQQRGRKLGYKKTTKDEDKQILKVFKKARPPGHYVDSRIIHTRLPKKLKKKVSRRISPMI